MLATYYAEGLSQPGKDCQNTSEGSALFVEDVQGLVDGGDGGVVCRVNEDLQWVLVALVDFTIQFVDHVFEEWAYA